ncbi:anthranilate synthase component II [Thermosulfuriphilus sp.]
MGARVVMIDNYDSFTYNLVQLLGAMGCELHVFRNDQVELSTIEGLDPTHLIISPGPCTPAEAGISVAAIAHFAGRLPILGVCLGHQSIGVAFGGRVVRAERLMHGKTSLIHHDSQTIYAGLPNPFEAMRYHSLLIDEESLPEELIVTARSETGEIMGIRHRSLPVEGVQFHPESIGTSLTAWQRLNTPPRQWDFDSEDIPEGVRLLRNFLRFYS